jgi:hypothetical protein
MLEAEGRGGASGGQEEGEEVNEGNVRKCPRRDDIFSCKFQFSKISAFRMPRLRQSRCVQAIEASSDPVCQYMWTA